MPSNPPSTSSDTESISSYGKDRTVFDEEESYMTDVDLPEIKQLASQTIGPNFACATTCRSLSISTGYYSVKNKLDDDGLDFEHEDSRPGSPDMLHTPERPYQRHGPCRYIFEDDHGFDVHSKRGWQNCAALVAIITLLLWAFVVWPVWRNTEYHRHHDPLATLDLTRQSGPFLPSELPTTSLR